MKTCTVRQGHDVAEAVRHDLLHDVRHLDDVDVHVDPCGHHGTDPHAEAEPSRVTSQSAGGLATGSRCGFAGGCGRRRHAWTPSMPIGGAEGRSRVSKSTSMRRSKPTALWVKDGEKADGDVGTDDAELASGDGDAGLAAAVDGVDRSGLGRRADGDAEVDVAQVGSDVWGHVAGCWLEITASVA